MEKRMTIQDQVVSALTMWRENRGGGAVGMQSVGNVIMNRAALTGHDPYTVCTTHEQFSAISMPGPEDIIWASDLDTQWQEALSLAQQMDAGTLVDITGGATNYYATSMTTPPYWAASMQRTVVIANQIFFK
jgi:spore germination cell wall hydrolase CwlJ-like protein